MPPSLEKLDLSGGGGLCIGEPHKFTGGIPTEWGSLTNLKEVNMGQCGLDGKLVSVPFNKATFEMRSRAQGCCLSRSFA